MKTTPTYQPSGEPYDGKPRVVVIKDELDMHTFDCYLRGIVIGFLSCIIITLLSSISGCSTPSQPPITTQPFSYMQYMISNGYVYRTNVVSTNEVWRAK